MDAYNVSAASDAPSEPCGEVHQAAACRPTPLDASVVGSVDESGNRVGGLIEEAGDRGRDDQPDREFELCR